MRASFVYHLETKVLEQGYSTGIHFVVHVMLKINVFLLQFVLKILGSLIFFKLNVAYNGSSKSCSISASAVTNHARQTNNLKEKRCPTKKDNMILLHNNSRVFEITLFCKLKCVFVTERGR